MRRSRLALRLVARGILGVTAVDAILFGLAGRMDWRGVGAVRALCGVYRRGHDVVPAEGSRSRIQADRGHRVVRDGPYRFVRHPMYTSLIVLMSSMALLLGSWLALAPALLIAVLLVVRTMFEDRMLIDLLPGYREYALASSGARHLVMFTVLIVWGLIALAAHPASEQSTVPPDVSETQPLIVIQGFRDGLAGVRAANPDVHLSIGRDPSIGEQRVLIVDYPAPTGDPAGRDVQCAAVNQDWTAGRAISFQVKPDHATRMSFSFVDSNRVAYTAWIDLQAGVWQSIRIPFDALRPNPFFQPPDAKRGAPIDVSDVKAIGFAPQDNAPGRLTIGSFVVSH